MKKPPSFYGILAVKQSDGTYSRTYDYAVMESIAYYKTEGCFPTPAALCGGKHFDRQNGLIGEQTVDPDRVNQTNTDDLPEQGSGDYQMCFYDKTCRAVPPRLGGLGCSAGGTRNCRFCGSGGLSECPESFSCLDANIDSVDVHDWSKDKLEWCCEHYQLGCSMPYNCFDEVEQVGNWSIGKQAWCCRHEELGCPFTCTGDQSGWSQDQRAWCATNSPEASIEAPINKVYGRLRQRYEQAPKGVTAMVEASSRTLVAFGLVAAVSFAATAAGAAAWRRGLLQSWRSPLYYQRAADVYAGDASSRILE